MSQQPVRSPTSQEQWLPDDSTDGRCLQALESKAEHRMEIDRTLLDKRLERQSAMRDQLEQTPQQGQGSHAPRGKTHGSLEMGALEARLPCNGSISGVPDWEAATLQGSSGRDG